MGWGFWLWKWMTTTKENEKTKKAKYRSLEAKIQTKIFAQAGNQIQDLWQNHTPRPLGHQESYYISRKLNMRFLSMSNIHFSVGFVTRQQSMRVESRWRKDHSANLFDHGYAIDVSLSPGKSSSLWGTMTVEEFAVAGELLSHRKEYSILSREAKMLPWKV